MNIHLLPKCVILSTVWCLSLGQIQAQTDKATQDKIQNLLTKKLEEWQKLYQYLHQNPELSFQEKQTAATLAQKLKEIGYEVTENFGGYGVVAVLKNSTGKTILVRADTDALPIEEQTNLPYRSYAKAKDDAGNEVPVMHACGHDLHMTVLVGVAEVMYALRKEWKGRLILIAQPAEERSGGAKAMLQQGLYQKFGVPNYALALHSSASLPAGKVGFCVGPTLANVDMIDITVYGVGGHGAYPHLTKDPIVLAAQIINNLQTIVSRQTNPIEPSVVTVGAIHGGTKHNIIPDKVEMQLTLRSYNEEVRNKTIDAIRKIIRYTALAQGFPEDRLPELKFNQEFTPFTLSDTTLTFRLKAVAEQILGKANVEIVPPSMGGEDFSFFGRTAEKVPICLFWLGAVPPDQFAQSQAQGMPLPSLHSPFFAPKPDTAIATGVKVMATSVLDLLKDK
ncbi:MAG: amidohydrolase [Microscillaceae bacterium]|nr:amidohydrolase [Microscillaceae bacterium]MDW8459684.1 amidohydrolase [Cytophagales bacterium]